MSVCFKCGKALPPTGSICPYCKANRNSDVEFVSFIIAMSFFFVIYFHTDDPCKAFSFSAIVGVVSMIFFMILKSNNNKSKSTQNKKKELERFKKHEEIDKLLGSSQISYKEWEEKRAEIDKNYKDLL